MSEPFLILHKVRGEPAFDVAEQFRCPVCEPIRQGLDNGDSYSGCDTCNDEQHWWIIPTSGHRAYPWWASKLSEVPLNVDLRTFVASALTTALKEEWPDHYSCNDRLAQLEQALRQAFPHFQEDVPITPDLIKTIGEELRKLST